MRIGEIVKKFRKERNLSVRAFAELSGISRSYINQIENDVENKRSLTVTKIAQLASALEMTPDELLAIVDDTKVDLKPKKVPTNTIPVPDLSELKKIPVLGHTACGSPIPAIREYDYLTVESTMKADFALVAEGKSMTGCGIMDGSLVLFQKTEAVDNGTVAAVTIGEATTIKKFYQYGDTVVLKPCNPEFDDQEYQGDELESIYVFGKAIGCLTKL